MSDLHGRAVARNAEIPIARLQYLASRIHKLGPRPFFELLRELISGADPAFVLERYARLAPLGEFISHLGGDRLPPPARLVGGRR
jgi:hypothetical protein